MEASRIANVTAVIAPMRPASEGVRARALAEARGLARLCGALFEEVIWLDGEEDPPPGCLRVRPERVADDGRGGLAAAAVAAKGDRLLWIGPVDGPEPALRSDVLLALVAWSEHVGVQPVDAAGRTLPLAIHRRADWLASGRGADGAPARDLRPDEHALERVTLAALGLDGAPAVIFAWRDGAE